MIELNLDYGVQEYLIAVVKRLIAIAPRRKKCIFLNMEVRDSESDTAISPDLFAVTKPLFGSVKREALKIDWETMDILMSLGSYVLEQAGRRHAIIDIIINEDEQWKAYRDDSQLRRLGGGDGMYRSRYRDYVALEPWLAELHKAGG